ncbi:MAG TPA: phosphoenolpyruvate carboxykinase (ATP) [Limnochordia bacterium]|nr:phosphoenolpyruvate carboxykinase (ATP) [Limnochordia bacterium]
MVERRRPALLDREPPAVQVSTNPSTPQLIETAVCTGEGRLAVGGPLVVATGRYTGRTPKDRFIVRDPAVDEWVDWGAINQPFAPEAFAALRARISAHLAERNTFRLALAAGADPKRRFPVQIVTEAAWAALFARNLLRRPPASAQAGQAAGEYGQGQRALTLLHAPSFVAEPERDGTRSGAFIILHLGEREILIGGTHYAGEIKKAVFSALNYYLPQTGVLPMHCSANRDRSTGGVALFFGLSGTGKTTLSTDPTRILIGDDEHGWSDDGVFNFEGGCYAKVIDISAQGEPEIYAAAQRFGTVLENVVIDEASRRPDFTSAALTENTRAAYPLEFIPSADPLGLGGQPEHLVMLTADAFGVLPPIARLTPEQAIYHFLSGYTAKVAGTEAGVSTPQATFSACFGEPFMVRPPTTYAELLAERIRRHRPHLWLINTGWTGGPYGVGRRMPLAATRALVRAALSGALNEAPVRTDPHFRLHVPTACPGVDPALLTPKSTWADGEGYDIAARSLARRYAQNFSRYRARVNAGVAAAGPAEG